MSKFVLIGIVTLIALTTTAFLVYKQQTKDIDFQGEEFTIDYNSQQGYKVSLYGRLSNPTRILEDTDGKVPLAVIVSDAGFTDLNCNNPFNEDQLYTNAYLQIAQQLSLGGVAIFRYNKRNIYPSVTNQQESDMTLDDQAEDLAEIVQQLQNTGKYNYISIIGHGEGSSVGMQAINQYIKKDTIVSMVLLNGYGFNAKNIMEYNLKFDLPSNVFKQTQQFLNEVQQGETPSCTSDMNEFDLCDGELGLLRPTILPYLTSLFKFSPKKAISQIQDMELYILSGYKDLIVIQPENMEVLQEANEEFANNQTIYKMNHYLKEAGDDRAQNIATYTNPKAKLNDSVVELLYKQVGW